MKIYLVGGAVRDQLLNFPFFEKDWVVVGSSPKEMIDLGYRPVGKDFPVFLHPETNEEYALARTERKTSPGYKGFTFHTDNNVTLEEDLIRRDLTINAMAQDDKGQIIDPYNGQQDIKLGYLRHVSDAFTEDPVRVLRVARFCSRYQFLGFRIASETMDLMQKMVAKGETKHLVPERVWQELHKALQEKTPSQFFISLEACGALEDILPELKTVEQKTITDNLTKMSQQTPNVELRFAALCFSLSKENIQSLCEKISTPNSFRDCAVLLKRFSSKIIQAYTSGNLINTSDLEKVLKGLDALRKPDRSTLIIEGAANLLCKEKGFLIQYWNTALAYYQRVNPQELIDQGYEKSQLGAAIHEQRLGELKLFLSEYKRD